MKDDVTKYPVLNRDDCPNQLYRLLGGKMDKMQEDLMQELTKRDERWLSIQKRQVNVQASTRLLWLAVLFLGISVLLTSC